MEGWRGCQSDGVEKPPIERMSDRGMGVGGPFLPPRHGKRVHRPMPSQPPGGRSVSRARPTVSQGGQGPPGVRLPPGFWPCLACHVAAFSHCRFSLQHNDLSHSPVGQVPDPCVRTVRYVPKAVRPPNLRLRGISGRQLARETNQRPGEMALKCPNSVPGKSTRQRETIMRGNGTGSGRINNVDYSLAELIRHWRAGTKSATGRTAQILSILHPS